MKYAVQIDSGAMIFVCIHANIYEDWFRLSEGNKGYLQSDSVKISYA
jgi:hypothetical protein